jgi:Permuted papain-like amidase enzyme, YaeF/YiiX, C92 family
VRSPTQALGDWFVQYVSRPREEYRRWFFNDPVRLKSRIRPGDVVLIDGDQRVSRVIEYLTMSSWSHTGIFIGSALLRDPVRRAEVRREFGSEARYLIVEALLDRGVVVSPLVKYIDFNLRLCRPSGLGREQIEIVLEYVLSRVGFTYDQRNIRDLFRYLLPFRLIPERLREDALHFGSGKETETICSSMLADAFAKIGFPIRPVQVRRRPVIRGRVRSWMFGDAARRESAGLVKGRHSSLCVPRDFDLSPYFDIVKFNEREPIRFDHVRQD